MQHKTLHYSALTELFPTSFHTNLPSPSIYIYMLSSGPIFIHIMGYDTGGLHNQFHEWEPVFVWMKQIRGEYNWKYQIKYVVIEVC